MSDALNVMKRARENEYFVKEQEREIAEYIAKLKSEGRYEEAMRRASYSASSSTSGALPQVLAHSVRVFDKKFSMKEEMKTRSSIEILSRTIRFLERARGIQSS